jgi:hypothetical protein
MKKALKTTTEKATTEATASGPINIIFNADKTPGEVYQYTIDSIEKAFEVIIALGSRELCHEAESRLKGFAARLHNEQFKIKGKALERGTFEELNQEPKPALGAWTIVNGVRVEGEAL